MTVRLTEKEKTCIKEKVKDLFGSESHIYIFGSRADQHKKGGDIDIYIEPEYLKDEWRQKIQLVTQLQILLGDQKIDVILSTNPERYIEKEAKEKGIKI